MVGGTSRLLLWLAFSNIEWGPEQQLGTSIPHFSKNDVQLYDGWGKNEI